VLVLADDMDKAQQIEEKNRQASIKRALNNRETPNIVNGQILCLDCYVTVPPERVKAANAVRCIECQTFEEIRLKKQGK